MARVVALIPDLLFGSKVQSTLAAEGHDVALVDRAGVATLLGQAQLLIVDLTDPELERPGLLAALSERGLSESARTLGFFAHVDVQVRQRAVEGGFDLVVPRSRMAREGAQLVAQLLAGAQPGSAA